MKLTSSHIAGAAQISTDALLRYIHTYLVATSQNVVFQDECSFVSLRDVQRVLDVSNWFYLQRDHLFQAVDGREDEEMDDEVDGDEEVLMNHQVCQTV